MPTVGAAVSVEVKKKFDAAARERRITSSRLAAALIADFLASRRERQGSAPEREAAAPTGSQIGPRSAAKTEQVYVRLAPHYYAELGRLASERHWYRSTYLANLFLAHADRRPVLCNAEIDAVRQVARQLAALGRQIDRVTARLSASPSDVHAIGIDVALVKALIELERQAVRALIKANLAGWGMDDEPT